MGLRNLFHKLKTGITRLFEKPLPSVSAIKKYGNLGEDEVICALQSLLPKCKIKRNIIIRSAEGNAEIDCLLLYKSKLFAIEIKHWKGHLTETENGFIKCKKDIWTNELHTKHLKSPFKQLGKAVFLLKRQIPENAWINSIVYFAESISVEASGENVWFNDIAKLVSYIAYGGKASQGNSAYLFFNRAVAADVLLSHAWSKSLRCTVCDDSVHFQTPNGVLTKHLIHSISITHHWSYDEITLQARSGECYTKKIENASISILENGRKQEYALSKIDYIEFG